MFDIKNKLFSRLYLFGVVLSINLATITTGALTTWTSPLLPRFNTINDDNPFGRILSSGEQSLLSAMYPLGGTVGPILAILIVDKIGRKKGTIYLSGIPFVLSMTAIVFSRSFPVYCVSRFISGVAYSNILALIPLYLAEISEASIRGIVTSSINVSLVFGEVITYVAGPFLSTTNFNILCLCIPILFLLSFPFCPESPYFYVIKRNRKDAGRCLRKIRNLSEDEIKKELESMEQTLAEDEKTKNNVFDLFRNRKCKKAFFICIGLMTFQQFSGISAVLFNTSDIFAASGAAMDADLSALIIGCVQLVASFVTPLFVDRSGRKKLMLFSCGGVVFSELLLGIYFFLEANEKYSIRSLTWLPLPSLIIFIVSFVFGLGSIPWIVVGELFPVGIKTIASTIISSYCWLIAFVISLTFKYLIELLTLAGTFWLFSFCSFLGIIFTIFCLYETKGKTFEEIQTIL